MLWLRQMDVCLRSMGVFAGPRRFGGAKDVRKARVEDSLEVMNPLQLALWRDTKPNSCNLIFTLFVLFSFLFVYDTFSPFLSTFARLFF